MKKIFLFSILIFILLVSCRKEKYNNAEIPLGLYESENFEENEYNFLYGRLEILEISKEEYSKANGINVGIDYISSKVIRKYFKIHLAYYSEKIHEFLHFKIQNLKYDSEKDIYGGTMIGLTPDQAVLTAFEFDSSLEVMGFLICSTYSEIEDSSTYDLPIGIYKSDVLEMNTNYFLYWKIEIMNILEEDYNASKEINVGINPSSLQFFKVNLYFYYEKTERWILFAIENFAYHSCCHAFIGELNGKIGKMELKDSIVFYPNTLNVQSLDMWSKMNKINV